MSYCINPNCPNPAEPLDANNNLICQNCGSELLLQGRYRVSQKLGSGGFGITYLVDDTGTSKVLKVLNLNRFDAQVEKQKAIELFQREARVLNQIRHSGIPRVEEGGYFIVLPKNSEEPLHCLVMEKIDGVTLEEWLTQRSNQPISQEQAIAWLKQLVTVLQELHQKHYFHRDIKPSNIMFRSQDKLVLIDFGAVREVTETYLNNQRGTGVISPGYTPREQMEGKAVPQSDFFALGRTFIYLLTGKSPNLLAENPRTGQLIWHDSAPHLSQPVVDLIDYLIKPFPGQRPHNAQEILQLITEIEKNVTYPQSAFTVVQVPEYNKINNGLIPTDRRNLIASHIEKRNKRIKQGVIGVLASYGLAIAFNSHMTNFMAFFNIIITGLGSLLICGMGLLLCSVSAIFLPFITTAGLTGYFLLNQQRYSSAFALFWTALNLFDSAAIIKGTRSIEITVEDENVRDYLLISLGWLQQAPLIGGLLHFIAFIILLFSIVFGFYSAQQEAPKERIVR
ncbi:MAG TPA: serine/threonine-protein kinase [Coleofasciculaceae cyanobacterium]